MIQTKVTSLEISKRLRDIGVKQESEFYWLRGSDKEHGVWCIVGIDKVIEAGITTSHDLFYSSFLAEELGEMLKPYLMSENQNELPDELTLYHPSRSIMDVFRADYWAEILEYLITNKLITI